MATTKKLLINRRNIHAFIGFIFILASCSIGPILNISGIKFYILSTNPIFVLGAFIFAYVLSSSFNQDHKDLIEFKNNLEYKVMMRTKQLKDVQKQRTNFFINFKT